MTRSTPHQLTGFLGYEVEFPCVAYIVADLDDHSVAMPFAARPRRIARASVLRRVASAMRRLMQRSP